MAKVIFKRMIHMIPILLIVVSITFFVTRILPSNPAVLILGPEASTEDLNRLQEEMGLNDNIFVQYGSYLSDLLRGDLGRSYVHRKPVIELILNVLPNTAVLAAGGILLSVLIGIPLGILAAVHKNRGLDYLVSFLTLIGVSAPLFWIGLILVLVFSVELRWLPVMGKGDLEKGLWDWISHMILPIITISTVSLANILIITRSSIIDVLNKDFSKSLTAFGIPKSVILYKHVLKNAMPAIINVIEIQLAKALSGAMLVEMIFNWPGMGKLIADAISSRDYTLVQGCVLFISIVHVLVNLCTDIVTYCVNPQFAGER